MVRRFSVNFAILSVVIDAALVALNLEASSRLRSALNAADWLAYIPGPISIPGPLYAVFPILWVAILASLSLYDGRKFTRAADEFTALTLASVLAAVALAGVLYFSFRDISRAQYLVFVGLMYLSALAWRMLARQLWRMPWQGTPPHSRRVIIVGTGSLAMFAQTRLAQDPGWGLDVLGFVDDETAEDFHGTLLGKVSELGKLVRSRGATDVIVALPPQFYGRTRHVVSLLTEEAVRVWIALGSYELAQFRAVTEDLAGLPLLDLRASALDEYERLIKRAFDLVVGSVFMFLFSPVMILAAAAILIADGRPVIFRQKRVGENGRLFEMLKFRTMVRDAEGRRASVESGGANGELIHKTRNDPRVTPLGRLLRRISIDELPQLINVLRGDMSLVGPRPELPYLVDRYEPWQRQRFAVPPGITGWWQVTGRSDRLMHMNTEDDLYYVRNYTIWLDLKIILRTAWVVLLGRGAY